MHVACFTRKNIPENIKHFPVWKSTKEHQFLSICGYGLIANTHGEYINMIENKSKKSCKHDGSFQDVDGVHIKTTTDEHISYRGMSRPIIDCGCPIYRAAAI